MKKLFLSILLFTCTLFAQNPRVILETSFGNITLKLFPSVAPKAVENFVTLCKEGYYDGVSFHRVVENFMIQSGDPTGTGAGGESIWKKKFEDEFKPNVIFDRVGLLAMANIGPNTNGSQFFITVGPAYWLNGAHTIFGEVEEGYEVVQKISNVRVGYRNKPIDEVRIIKTIVK